MTFQASILSILIFIPILGAIVTLLLPRTRTDIVRWTAFGVAALNLVLALILLLLYSQSASSVFVGSPFAALVGSN